MSHREGGPLAGLRRWNRRRLERRRWRRELLEALADDDAAIMAALAALLEEVRAGGAAQQALAVKVGALEAQGAARAADAFPSIATARAELLEPELAVLARLAPSLAPGLALDVGAHHGRFSAAMLDLGFRVHALEPNPAARAELERRLAGREGLTVHACAAGAADGEAVLRLVASPGGAYADPSLLSSLAGLPLPGGLVEAGQLPVRVRRLDGLLREAGLPPPAVVKVDAEGTDLDVLRGLGEVWPAVLVVEFWDEALPFSGPGARNRLPELVAHARARGAAQHLAVFRRWGDDRPAFFSGWSASPERSWGNLLFFSDPALHRAAREHLAALIPEARFVAAPGA